MGDVVPFRKNKKRQWTRPEDYGAEPDPPKRKPPKKPRGSKRRWLRPWMFWLVASIGIGLWVAKDPALLEPPSVLASDPERLDGKFTLCGTTGSANCVIDGDTIRVGKRSIRIIGIDAPEIRDARCEAEGVAGRKARDGLLALLNAGPVQMVGRIDDPRDQYGRELRALRRVATDGTETSIADQLVAQGLVREYRGGSRQGWCGELPGG
ncbi:MAG: thermonuclease family protein [Sphingomonadaceae bacterium]